MRRLSALILITVLSTTLCCYSAPPDLFDLTNRKDSESAKRSKDSPGNLRTNPSTALFEYASRGDFESVKRYKDSGGNLHTKDAYGNNALLIAAENGYSDIVKYLIDNKAEIDIVNQYGYTPLLVATINEHAEAIKLLLAAGADINFKNQYNSSALDYMIAMNSDSPEKYIATLPGEENPPSSTKGPNSFFYLKGWEKRALVYMDEHKTELAVASVADAAANGDRYAQYLMGKMYMEKDKYNEGVAFLTLAADAGITDAQYLLGAYFTGGHDPINGKKGLVYLEAAAGAAHKAAIIAYGRAYLLGIGARRDTGAAKSSFERGIKLGNPDGEYYLGIMHYYAIGLSENKDLGYKLINSAADRGSSEAVRQLARFATENTLDYLLNTKFTRAGAKAYMLSQGALQASEKADCDSYTVNTVMDRDYGISEIAFCFPQGGKDEMIFKVSPAIHSIYKEYLLNYKLKIPVRYDVSGE
ncbi:MAG: ankyrin repeat domain-containing protein [Deferribacteraceae bacterium]|jgi:hypothetical protein|nr:ankyrin repeat domain-containing protein [Deferribacteraceae bacterium]